MWQLNRNSDFSNEVKDDFTLKGTQVQVKLQKRGDFLVQGALSFNMKGGYLSKAINRRRGGSFIYLLQFIFQYRTNAHQLLEQFSRFS